MKADKDTALEIIEAYMKEKGIIESDYRITEEVKYIKKDKEYLLQYIEIFEDIFKNAKEQIKKELKK